MTFIPVTIQDGSVVNGRIISNMAQNDEWLYNKVNERPKGIIFHKQGYNGYTNAFATIYTDNAHNGTGTAKGSATRILSGKVKVEPSRYYMIYGSAYLEHDGTPANWKPGSETGGYTKFRLYVNGNSKQIHIPQNVGVATGGNDDANAETGEVWYLWESPSELRDEYMIFSLRMNIMDYITGSGGAAYPMARAQCGSGSGELLIPFVTVTDYGSVLRTTTSV